MKTLADLIVEGRDRLGIDAMALAKRAGISASYLSELENGTKTNPRIDVVRRLGRELGIDLGALGGG